MKNSSIYNDTVEGMGQYEGVVARRKVRFRHDVVSVLLSLLPSSAYERELYSFIMQSYKNGLERDWKNIGGDMWLSVGKFASNV